MGAALAVEGSGQDASRRRLTDAAGTGKDEGLCQPAEIERIPKGLRDAVLTDDVLKSLRPILPGENLIGHRLSMPRDVSWWRDPPRPGRACGTCQ